MSLATGVLVGAFAWVAGLQFALEWGVIAFALNYIPFIGPFIATLFPTLLAMAQFATWQAVVGVFVCLNIIQFVVGSYIEPRVSGACSPCHPRWCCSQSSSGRSCGACSAPSSASRSRIAIVTFCSYHPSSRWVSDLLGGPVEAKPAREPLADKV